MPCPGARLLFCREDALGWVTQWLPLSSFCQDNGKRRHPLHSPRFSLWESVGVPGGKVCRGEGPLQDSGPQELLTCHTTHRCQQFVPALMFLLACSVWWCLLQVSKSARYFPWKPIPSDLWMVVCPEPQFSDGPKKSCYCYTHLAFLSIRLGMLTSKLFRSLSWN